MPKTNPSATVPKASTGMSSMTRKRSLQASFALAKTFGLSPAMVRSFWAVALMGRSVTEQSSTVPVSTFTAEEGRKSRFGFVGPKPLLEQRRFRVDPGRQVGHGSAHQPARRLDALGRQA